MIYISPSPMESAGIVYCLPLLTMSEKGRSNESFVSVWSFVSIWQDLTRHAVINLKEDFL